MSQTAYSLNQATAMLGMKADAMFDLVESAWVSTIEAIPVGRICVKDISFDNGCQLPDGTNQEFIGGAILEAKLVADNAGVVAYPVKDTVNILREGKMWVWTEQAVNPDTSSVFVRITDGGAGKARGQCRIDADTAAAIAFPKAKFRSTTSGAGLVLLEINCKP